MVQIYQDQPSFASKLIGSGVGAVSKFGTALTQEIKKKRIESEKKEKELAKQRSKLQQNVPKYLKNYGTGIESLDEKNRLLNSAEELLNSGLYDTAEEATQAAYAKMQADAQNRNKGTPEAKKQSFLDKLQNYGGMSSKEVGENIYGGAAKFANAFASAVQFPFEIVRNLDNYERQQLYKKQGMTSEQIKDAESKFHKSIAEREKRTHIPDIIQGKGLPERLSELTGGRSEPQTGAQRILQGTPFGPAGIAGAAAGEAAAGLNLPEPIQHAAEFMTFILSHKLNTKVPGFRAANAVIKKAENVAAKTGAKTEEVIAKAQQESGADLAKAQAGNMQEIKKLKDAITAPPEVSGKIASAEKTFFNKKAALKERETFGARLPETPFEEHFGVAERKAKTEASKLPETRAKEEAIRQKLQPLEEQAWKEYQDLRRSVAEQKRHLKTINAAERPRMESMIKHNELTLERNLEKIKDIQYEMKYGRPRPTEAQIDAQVADAIDRLKAEIKNPTPEGQKKLTKELAEDSKYIETAEKILSGGEMPGEIRPDTYIKMKNKYLEGYKEAVAVEKEILKELRGAKDKASLKKKAQIQDSIKHMENRIRSLSAQVTQQKDNIKVMRALEKPSGSFYKQQLKSLRSDLQQFQKDYFHHAKESKTPIQEKVEKLGHNKMAERIPKAKEDAAMMEEVIKNPTPENLENASKTLGTKPEEMRDIVKGMGEKVDNAATQVKTGTASPKSENLFAKRLKKYAITIGVGGALGGISALWEEAFGYKPNYTILRGLNTLIGFGALGSTNPGYTLVRDLFESGMVEELKERRDNPSSLYEYKRKIVEHYGEKKWNRLIKKMKEQEAA